jgi:hypothetical protein
MTIIEAINRLDLIKPNTYTQQEKVRWLSALDGVIKANIIDTHEGGDDVVFNGYDEITDISTTLLVPPPYDTIYLRWLEAQIDYANAEFGKYSNSKSMYNAELAEFEKFYNRTHMPLGKKFKFF